MGRTIRRQKTDEVALAWLFEAREKMEEFGRGDGKHLPGYFLVGGEGRQGEKKGGGEEEEEENEEGDEEEENEDDQAAAVRDIGGQPEKVWPEKVSVFRFSSGSNR